MRQNDDDIAFEKRDVELSFGVALHLTFFGNAGVVELVEICASAWPMVCSKSFYDVGAVLP